MSNTFIEQCLNGDALLEDIDDFIAQWHEDESTAPLHEHLGMTKEEYALWLKLPELLPLIIKSHKDENNYAYVYREGFYKMAARAENIEKANKLKQWLVSKGLWED